MTARLQFLTAADAPPPGDGCIHLVAVDLQDPGGTDVVRGALGEAYASELLGRQVRWLLLAVGNELTVAFPPTEAEWLSAFAGVTALHLTDIHSLVLVPACGPELRARLREAVQLQQLIGAAEGQA